MLFVYAASAAITAAIQLGGFSVAFALQTEVFYDVMGGLNYMALVMYSILSVSNSDGSIDARKIASSALFVISRGWLLGFLLWRAHDRGGDSRFEGVSNGGWPQFGRFLLFWVVQGVWCFVISLPMLYINASPVEQPLSSYDWAMLAGFALGIVVEIVADIQKTLFVKAGRKGTFCQDGLWSLSRHPNYFGEILQWWCHWGLAVGLSTELRQDVFIWACLASPLFTMHILLNVPETGIAQAEGKGLKRYYEKCPDAYAEYRKNTSILVPLVGYRQIPMFMKRAFLFEWSKYEYRPKKAAMKQG